MPWQVLDSSETPTLILLGGGLSPGKGLGRPWGEEPCSWPEGREYSRFLSVAFWLLCGPFQTLPCLPPPGSSLPPPTPTVE